MQFKNRSPAICEVVVLSGFAFNAIAMVMLDGLKIITFGAAAGADVCLNVYP